MKKQVFILCLTTLVCTLCMAQQDKKIPKWLSDKGYWMIQSNVNTPKNSTIYFFNTDNVLIYQEEVLGMKIKTRKQKTLMRLKSALEEASLAWEKGHKSIETDLLIAKAFRK